VRVPNVPQFKIEDVKEVDHFPVRTEFSKRVIKIDTRYRMLDVYDGDKIVCSYPITPVPPDYPHRSALGKSLVSLHSLGSVGMKRCWSTVIGAIITSIFRPGREIPVGILWMGLNKRGIGIHGTNSPNTIGRAASHGCIRLANWDAARVVNQVTEGITVQIY